MKTDLTVTKLLNGVFAYLDAVLPAELQQEAGAKDHGVGLGTAEWNGARATLAKIIFRTFRTQFWGSPLKPVLGEFNLHNQDDMADALAAAYCRHKAGGNPIDALNADYGINHGGLLSWVDVEGLREAAATRPESDEARRWFDFQKMYEPGDRIVHYSLPTRSGYYLVRGDRLVWEICTLHMTITQVSPAYTEALERFKALGGYPAFFAGKFTWPPEGMGLIGSQKVSHQPSPSLWLASSATKPRIPGSARCPQRAGLCRGAA